MTDTAIEQEIQTKGLTAPRITPADIQAAIKSEHYFTADDGEWGASRHANKPKHPQLSLLTFCVLVLQNGFTVTGESACASPENFDVELGRKIARRNAEAKIWPLLGYELRTKLSTQPKDHRDRVRTELANRTAELDRLSAFIGGPAYESLSAEDRLLLVEQQLVMRDFVNVLARRIAAFED